LTALTSTRAIRRTSEAFEKGKAPRSARKKATGTGKTRTIMGLVDLFLQTCQAQKVLFVADRDALVEQALNRRLSRSTFRMSRGIRIQTANIDKDKRLYVCHHPNDEPLLRENSALDFLT